MVLEFSDRQLQVRLPASESEEDDLFVKEIGKDIVGRHADLAVAIQMATSLPMDLVLTEVGLAFPRAAERFGGTSGVIHLYPAEPSDSF